MDALTFSERCLEDDYYYILGCNDSSSVRPLFSLCFFLFTITF